MVITPVNGFIIVPLGALLSKEYINGVLVLLDFAFTVTIVGIFTEYDMIFVWSGTIVGVVLNTFIVAITRAGTPP